MNKTAKIISACAAFVLAAGLGALAYINRNIVGNVPTPYTETPPGNEAHTEPFTLPVYENFSPSPKGMTEMAKLMLKKNKDYAGWIRIANTGVDYPFVKDPGEIYEGQSYYDNEYHNPNSYYLHKNFNRDYEFAGALFMDYRNEFGAVEETQSENIVIYGHNMLDLTMFGSLRQYYNDYDFWKKAPFIELSSNYENYDYVVCGNSITSGYKESDFVYWDMEELDTKENFDYFVQKMREKQIFDTGVDVEYGDKLLTLSTCYGASENNMRFILVARRLRDGETAGDMKSIERTEEYRKKQKEKEKDKDKENSDTKQQ